MVGSKHTRRCATALGMCTVLAGCIGLGDPRPNPSRPRPRPQAAAAQAPAPGSDLRIPADTVARTSDIPLVPVPPPPVGREAPPAQPNPMPAAPPATPPAAQAAPVPSTPPPQTPPRTARQVLQTAAARYAGIDSYIVRMMRRDQTKDRNAPEELLLFKFRKEPFSVHFKWLGEAGHGREVVYVKGHYENKIHTLLAAGDAPLMPAGSRFAVAPDSILARTANRHPITEAGIGACIDILLAFLDAQDRGDTRKGTLAVLAPQRRPEYNQPVETLERVIPPGVEPELPRGGRRLICFDPEWQLPMTVVTYDDRGQQVEYYHSDRLQAGIHLDDDDFNPDKLWGPKKAGTPTPPGGESGRAKPLSH